MCRVAVAILHFFVPKIKKTAKIFGGCYNLLYFCIANENCNLLDV